MTATLAGTLAEVLPLAAAIALSPLTIIPAILLLFTERPRATAATFLAGWLFGLAVILTATSALASRIEPDGPTPTWLSWARIGLGVLLLVLAIRRWLARHAVAESPRWLQAIGQMTPGRALGLGVVLSVANPKVLLLAAAAGLGLGSAGLPPGEVVVGALVTALVASVTVILPLVAYLVLGQRAMPPLTRARDWLERNNAVVMAVVFAVLGVVVLLEGLTGL
jgi:uncharacterized membrane protein YjfL (UPF0719 family)